MAELHVGIRELKGRLSEYLRLVAAGQTVVITQRGRQVGRIVPMAPSLDERLQAMVQVGLAVWSGTRLQPMLPVAHARGERTVAELLVEERG